MELMELRETLTLSREEAAARLHAIADELGAGNDLRIERGDLRFVAHVPDRINLRVEFEIQEDRTELDLELTWRSNPSPSAVATFSSSTPQPGR